MNPIVYIGNICIGLSIGISILGIFLFYGARQIKSEAAASWGRGAVYANFILMTVANLAMVHALLGNNFGVSYVAHVGSLETPRWVSAISLWSSLEGSILLWGWVLAAYSAACVYLNREKNPNLMDWVGLTLLAVQIFFYVLLAMPANPFLPVDPAPANGPGPNPLLQNHWLMALHPPCLYIGYIGFTVPFSFAIASLIEKDFPGEWIVLSRRWTLFAWSFLSMAIVLGAWWSYAVLGWGGYWAWDPVENASFMPWLTGTALVHSVIVQEKRKILARWNILLAILTFLLTILGTFLTRSGVLESVHSFTESEIGAYFLFFMGIVLAVSLALILWRAPEIREAGKIENLASLEVLFLFNNLLFVSFCFIVFLGTLYPLAVEALRDQRISVGQPYFNQMAVPITGMILLLMGIGLITPWRKVNFSSLVQSAKLPGVAALFLTIASFLLGARHPWVAAIVLFAGFAFFVMLAEWLKTVWKRSDKKILRFPVETARLFVEHPRRYGGFVSHLGVLMIVVGIAFSSAYEKNKEITLKKGESAVFQSYTLKLADLRAREVPQRFEVKALIDVESKGRSIATLKPQMNYYPNSREPIGSPAVHSTLLEDLYLTLIHFEKDGSGASLRVIVSPAVAWIWIGGIVVMLGGILALSLGRRRTPKETP